MFKKLTTPAMAIMAALSITPLFAADKWQDLNVENTPGLAGNEIQFIKPMNGEVWIGTLSGLSVYRDGEFEIAKQEKTKWQRKDGKRVQVTELVPSKTKAWDIIKTGDGSYLVGVHGGLIELEDGVLGKAHLSGKTVSPILDFGDGNFWALGKDLGTETNTLFHNEDGAWKPIPGFADQKVADVTRTKDGHIWVMIDGDGVMEIAPENGIQEAKHHLKGMNVTSVFQTREGKVCCGTWGRGVAMQDGGKWTYHLSKMKSAILGMAEDKDGNIWIATTADGAQVHR